MSYSVIVPAGSYTVNEARKVRVYQESARLDYSVTVAPGVYPLFTSLEWSHAGGGGYEVRQLWARAPGSCERSVTTREGEVRETTIYIERYWTGDAAAKPAALELAPQFAIHTWLTGEGDDMSRLVLATGAKVRVTVRAERAGRSDEGVLEWPEGQGAEKVA
jgi:hypothetical protein